MDIAATFTPFIPTIAAAGALGAVSAAWWLALWPRLAIGLLFASLVAGQLIRLPLPGQGGGLLLSDIAVVGVLCAAGAYLARKSFLGVMAISHPSVTPGQTRSPDSVSEFMDSGSRAGMTKEKTTQAYNREEINNPHAFWFALTATPFFIWSLWSLVVHIPELGIASGLIAAAYWMRLLLYLAILPALIILFRDPLLRKFSMTSLMVTIWTLVLFGFVQLPLFSDLTGLALRGWDPHQFRLVSTWLDPNFFGGFLVLALLYLAGRSRLYMRQLALLVLVVGALLFTESRSSFVALVLTVTVISPLFLVRWLGGARGKTAKVCLITGVLGISMAWLLLGGFALGERATRFIVNDPTVALRVQSLAEVWRIVEQESVIGVGYNAYQFKALKEGLISGFSIHSRAGADSSLLTLWVTTGIIGVMLFILPWAYITHTFVVRWLRYGNRSALAGGASIVALLMHAQFVNSFLYGHLLIVLSVIVALILSQSPQLTAKHAS